ncbi:MULTISPECIES: ABC transporter substrate-binding protein [unclassified Kitasatospora]|uniref:peptide ABC transporter substrate-binding protein n=1 Tax=unclassified Kitasatospora TaxID=2633591 RepID=UPI000709BAC3|nr:MULTISPECIES: ABC transporter substrate-binding protein [unclassified Kitasatospora]KQV23798.1 peptide ABC transporter substrate-binding protein [Kitasatospora sp. Root107]KRB67489.1 peptide ABC transporter substrate-binding protein [Kitasatospora sp. Root187]
MSIISWNGTEPENPLVPGDATERDSVKIVNALFTGLVEYDPNTAEPRTAVAKSIDSADSRVYRITLNPGWTFHDGTPVTAASFVDAWNYTAYGPNGLQGAEYLSHIQGYEATQNGTTEELSGLRVIDDSVFEVTLSAPFSAFVTQLGYTAFFPLPRSFFADSLAFEAHPVGNGPFSFGSHTPGVNIVLNRYEAYAGARKPRVDGVEFRFYRMLEDAYADVVANRLDYLDFVPADALDGGRYKQELAGRYVAKPYMGVQSISFPMWDPRFGDRRVRQAISMAIDRQYVIDTAFDGDKMLPDGLVPPIVPGYGGDASGDLCTYQPEKARALFETTGFEGPIELTSNDDSANQVWIDAACRTITAALGVEARYAPVPTFGEFRKLINEQKVTTIFRSGWVADYPSIENFLNPIFRTGAAVNGSGYSNPEVDALLAEADAAPSEKEGWELYQQAEKMILQDMPAIPLWYQKVESGWSTRTGNVTVTPLLQLDLFDVTIED